MINRKNSYAGLTVVLITFMLLGAVLPAAVAESNIKEGVKGFDKGVSWQPVVPLKKVTFINFDENSYLDDYAYLAAVPTTVFYDKTSGRLFSYPLLYYQDPYPVEDDKERSLNARQGIDYFMEDWMSYCNGRLDQMILVNVDRNDTSQWKAKEIVSINGEDPYSVASDLVLQDWSYSDEAVLAVIDESFERLNNEETGVLKGKIKIDKSIKEEHFEVEQTNSLNPVSHDFIVPEGYMYVYARCWYPSLTIKISLPLPGFEMSRQLVIPSGDKDLQVYCMYNGGWMQTLALDAWNSGGGMDKERGGTYAYSSGKWRAAVTDIPTKKLIEIVEVHGSWLEILKNLKKVVYKVDIAMYPGDRIPLFNDLPFDCKNVKIELKCKSSSVNLSFCLIGPSGEEIASDKEGVIEVEKLGGLLPGESHDLAIYTTQDIKGSFDYEIHYSYQENKTKYEADCLTNAVEGSILASMLNAPLLYLSKDELPQKTIDALYRLGVEKIYLVNLGSYLSNDVRNKLKEIVTVDKDYRNCEDIYDAIRDITGSNDIIISTTEPWRPWYV
ncbi:MAG TPA: hypothetical protein ENI49_03530, partial [Thermoplasmatales archaeon]|nr:hypothetical protein [Thermoplasmatales archaeon]